MTTYNLAATFTVGIRHDPTTVSSTLEIPIVTLTQVKAPYVIDLVEVSGTN